MSNNTGFLVPDRYVFHVPSDADMNTSSIFWGFSLGAAFFSALRAGSQSVQLWRRKGRVTAYVAMIWVEWIASVVIGVIAWCFQRQYIKASFQLFLCTSLFWSIQIQLLMQIIINRIGILMTTPGQATRLKWIVFLVLLLVNISVIVIWVPAQLQISARWVLINEIWDRIEKVIFLIVDVSLNLRFIYLVRSRLIRYGLSKYIPLFRFNIVMVCFSMCLDVVLIGLMSLDSKLVYLQFHPVAYLLKLHIEMNMADLIAKIARVQHCDTFQGRNSGASGASKRIPSMGHNPIYYPHNVAHVTAGNEKDFERIGHGSKPSNGNIKVVMETAVTRNRANDLDDIDIDIESRTSSMQELRKPHVDI